jgi:hypothetical protein
MQPKLIKFRGAVYRKAIAVPSIHLNGSGKEHLLNEVTEAGSALHAAIDALYAATPNGRDYYTQGPDALRQALAEHTSRLSRLESVLKELQQLAEAIDDGGFSAP